MDKYKDNVFYKEYYQKETVIQFAGSKPNGKFRFGLGISEFVGEQASNISNGRALYVVDPVVHELNIDQYILDSLKKFDIKIDIFNTFSPEPSIDTLEELKQIAEKNTYSLIIGVGGGSCLDIAKCASVICAQDIEVEQLLSNPESITDSLPKILMPTTAGTGSEMSPYVVFSNGDKKEFSGSEHFYATVVMVDPVLSIKMPRNVTISSGLDALTHGVEGAISDNNPFTMAVAQKCIKLVFEYLPRAVFNGEDIQARYNMAFAAVLGMLAYTQGGGLFAHSISYVLTSKYKLPHGAGCGLSLPYTLMFNKNYIEHILSEYSKAIDKKDFIKELETLLKEIDAIVTLKDVGVKKEELDNLAKELVNKYDRQKNPRKMRLEESISLMYNMYEGINKEV